MEGVGSRLGRSSSRYGPAAAAAAASFNGPVRKWKKKWMHVSSTSSSTANHHKSHSQSNDHTKNNSHLLLCRWTPLSSATTEEPPKRKFRYTPIAVLEEQRRAAKTGGSNQFTALQTSKNDGPSNNTTFKTDTQDSRMSNLDLGLCLQGHSDDPNCLGQTKEGQVKKASSGGFWMTS